MRRGRCRWGNDDGRAASPSRRLVSERTYWRHVAVRQCGLRLDEDSIVGSWRSGWCVASTAWPTSKCSTEGLPTLVPWCAMATTCCDRRACTRRRSMRSSAFCAMRALRPPVGRSVSMLTVASGSRSSRATLLSRRTRRGPRATWRWRRRPRCSAACMTSALGTSLRPGLRGAPRWPTRTPAVCPPWASSSATTTSAWRISSTAIGSPSGCSTSTSRRPAGVSTISPPLPG